MELKRVRIGLICCFLFFISSIDAFGCTLSISPLRRFDRSEYIFIGEVVGIVGPFESEKFVNQAWGLRVKVISSIFIPKISPSYFEVFDFDLVSDCSTWGKSKAEVSKSYSIGSKIKVIAKEAKLLPNRFADGNIRLEILPDSLGSISRNAYKDGTEMSSIDSVFDYRAFDKLSLEDKNAYYFLPHFELRKDLLRLEKAKTQNEQIKILERLLYYPICCGFEYYGIVETYIHAPRIRKTLVQKRKVVENQQ